MSNERTRRVNEVLRQVLSQAVADLADPRLGFVTVTGVDCTNDFDHATVHVQVLGGDDKRERGLEALEGARGALQARIAREVRLRRVPRLHFAYDPSLDNALRIGQLLDDHAHEHPPPDDET
jgi:ribosome-binding factor A